MGPAGGENTGGRSSSEASALASAEPLPASHGKHPALLGVTEHDDSATETDDDPGGLSLHDQPQQSLEPQAPQAQRLEPQAQSCKEVDNFVTGSAANGTPSPTAALLSSHNSNITCIGIACTAVGSNVHMRTV